MQRTLQGDPIDACAGGHLLFRALTARMHRLLLDEDEAIGGGQRVATAMLTSAITGAVTHPLVADLDDQTLRTELMRYVRRLVNLPADRRRVVPKPEQPTKTATGPARPPSER